MVALSEALLEALSMLLGKDLISSILFRPNDWVVVVFERLTFSLRFDTVFLCPASGRQSAKSVAAREERSAPGVVTH